jgi:mannitol-specific phosphotransferase system IIBC component
MKFNLIDRSGNVVLGIIIAVVVTALVVAGLTYSWQKKQGDNKVAEVFKQAEEAKNKASELTQKLSEEQKKLEELVKVDENAPQEWVSYTSANYNLSFFYPKGWSINDSISTEVHTYIGIALTPPTMTGDFQWGIQFYKSSDTTVDKIINNMGKQFTDREVVKEKITINGLPATKVVVTTATIPDWYSEAVVITKDKMIYEIGNGAIKDDKFATFYNSIIIK